MGAEVMSLLAPPDEQASLRELTNGLDKGDLQSIAVGPVVPLADDRVTFSTALPIWVNTTQPSPAG